MMFKRTFLLIAFLLAPASVSGQIQQFAKSAALPASEIKIDPLFSVARLLTADRDKHGSWVVMTEDETGRLVISAQHREGLIRITLSDDGGAVKQFEHLSHLPGKAQGLLFHAGALYLVRNETTKKYPAGLYRLDDIDSNSTSAKVTLLSRFHGSPQSEHGPHALLADPEGKGLLLVAGNHTKLPSPLTSDFVIPTLKDRVGKRLWDPRGHAVNIRAPGGWITRYNLEDGTWDLVATGFRNAYDMALNSRGDLFAFDSDMEWDRGTPWYRPTALYHVTQGAEFGWRSGTSKWPWSLMDLCSPLVAMGEGSPTGVFAGTHASFPPQYQDSIYVMDWSHGTIRRVAIEPQGASYKGVIHPFIEGRPLPLTDGIIRRKDGALYFITGGRYTQSGLYRVAARESAPAEDGHRPKATEEATLRKHLEAPGAPIELIWGALGHADRRVRYAARLALERRDVGEWRKRALLESTPVKQLNAMCALARAGNDEDATKIILSLTKRSFLDWPSATHMDHLRTIELCLSRHPSLLSMAKSIADFYVPHFPTGTPATTRQMARILSSTNQTAVPPLLLTELLRAPTQETALSFAFCLSNATAGMTPAIRKRYFAWLSQAGRLEGGKSLVGFIAAMQRRALSHAPANERVALAATRAHEPKDAADHGEIMPRTGKQWSRNDFLDLGWKQLKGCNFANGEQMYRQAKCMLCHEFKGKGIGAGPDLTSAGGRFSAADLLLHTIEPSREVSDQYRATNIFCHDGRILTGRIVERTERELTISTEPTDLTVVESISIKSIDIERTSRISTMPQGLLDGLKRQDILDLLAYIIAAGDPKNAAFR